MSCECEKTQMVIAKDGPVPVVWCFRCGRLSGRALFVPRLSHVDKCHHRDSAQFRGASWEWCEDCGAVRTHKNRKPLTYWQKPGGAYGKDPGSLRPIPPKRKKVEE